MPISNHIVFLCTGNTCRSPMAEGYLNAKAKELGLPIEAKSAGMSEDNQKAADNAIEAMKEIGIDISNHRSHHLTPAMVNWADVIAVMTQRHKDILTLMLGLPGEKIQVLGSGVPDPYGGNLEIYEKTRDALIECANQYLPGFRIVDMEEKHVKSLARIHADSMPDAWSEDGFRAELSKETATFRVAEDMDGTVLGFYGIYTVMETAEIAQIAVSPEARRKKIGSWLLADAIKQAKEKGAEKLELDVRESNTGARILYESFGFTEDGKRKSFYKHPDEDAILYSLAI